MNAKRTFIHVVSSFIWSRKKRKAFRNHFATYKNNQLIIVKADGTKIINPVFPVSGLHVDWYGHNSTVIIHESTRFYNCHLAMGNDNVIDIAKSMFPIEKFDIPWKMSDGSCLKIKEDFSCVGCRMYMHDEPGFNVEIGKDCMFSFDITIWPSDGHAYYDYNSPMKVLNVPNRNIRIGDHCWLCRGVTLLKNSGLGNNCIVGYNTVVNKIFTQDKVIIVGIPGKIVKENINWDRDNTYGYLRTRKNK